MSACVWWYVNLVGKAQSFLWSTLFPVIVNVAITNLIFRVAFHSSLRMLVNILMYPTAFEDLASLQTR